MGNYCPVDGSHQNWYGALFCGHCGSRMMEKIVRCKECQHEITGGNDLVGGWGTKYCTLCGADSSSFEITVRQAEGRADLLPSHIRGKL